MSARVELVGLEGLRIALRQLPADLAREAGPLVESAGESTAAQLRQNYPEGETGNLRKGVKVTKEASAFGMSVTVRSTSKHAHLWEFGTQNRKTRQGWHRGRGPEHKREGLVPIAQRARKKLNGQLVDVVRRAGFDVTGTS